MDSTQDSENLHAELSTEQARIARDQIKPLRDGLDLIRCGVSKIDRSTAVNYYLNCLLTAYDLLLTRFAPYRVGDKVTLSDDAASRNRLQIGCRTVVVEVNVDIARNDLTYIVKDPSESGRPRIYVTADDIVVPDCPVGASVSDHIASLDAEIRFLRDKINRISEHTKAAALELSR